MHAKLVTEFKFDTEFPRDHVICTLNFNSTGPAPDWSDIAGDLADVWNAGWLAPERGAVPMRISVIDNEGTPPVYPVAVVESGWNAAPMTSNAPREVALCLSYYAERNIPRRRGRVYLPCGFYSDIGREPATTRMQKALDLADDFSALGGLDIDWEVWSPTNAAGMTVTNAWVDQEWDTQRRRGLRTDVRLTASVSG